LKIILNFKHNQSAEKLEQEIYINTYILWFSRKKTVCIVGSSNSSLSRRFSVWFRYQAGSWYFYTRGTYF